MQARADKAKEIFLQALELTSDAARSSFIDSRCGTDTELRQRVETLLLSHRPDDSFLDPRKLHPNQGTGNTHTSDFADTDESPGKVGQKPDAAGTLSSWFDPPTQPDSLGRFLHYEILEELGQGGFGIVYRVFDEKLHRVVALKILSPTLASNGAARQRFLREARAGAAVRHEHVISIHAVDDAPLPHLVMEYISGQTLQQKIEKVGTLHLKEILRIGMQIAQGLEAAHRQGLIHRDIKPSNILLENGIERVKISDFGLARAVDDSSISHQGLIVGTPMFMSPEQAEGKPVDARTDLFSLGSTMYAMCTGQSPFIGQSTLSVLKKVVEGNPAPLRSINPEVPDWLEALIFKLLAKKPEDRFSTALDVSNQLSAYLAELQLHGQVAGTKKGEPQKDGFFYGLIIVLLGILGTVLAIDYGSQLFDWLFRKPPQPAVQNVIETDKTKELESLVKLKEEHWNQVIQQYKAGVAPHDDVLSAKIKWLQEKVNLAEVRQNVPDLIDCLTQIKQAQNELLKIGEIRLKAGVIRTTDLTAIKEGILNTETKLAQAKQRGKAKD
ncbi:MAG TPA: serine/threonine-protein kinase [Gemmatales bacterium]|nr:serine/threonine-protein kinase [Gemmatales bacterium]